MSMPETSEQSQTVTSPLNWRRRVAGQDRCPAMVSTKYLTLSGTLFLALSLIPFVTLDAQSKPSVTADGWLLNSWSGPALGQKLSLTEQEALPQPVFADGTGLPEGEGNARAGAQIYADKCAQCHGSEGQGARSMELVGDRALLNTDYPDRGIGVFWPNAATLFDYIYRSMPPDEPASMSVDQVYSVIARLLVLNELLPENERLNAQRLATIEMPNRNGFVTLAR